MEQPIYNACVLALIMALFLMCSFELEQEVSLYRDLK